MINLVLTPAPTPGRFIASLGGQPIVTSDQPLADGARILIDQGRDPAELVTIRHAGKAFDSFDPMPLSYWAAQTYAEGNRTQLKRAPYRPRPDGVC